MGRALTFTVDDDRPGHAKRMSKPTKTGKPRFHWLRVLHPNGTAHWRTKHEVMQKDKTQVLAAVRDAGWSGEPMDSAGVRIVLYVRRDGRRDEDAFGYQVKGVLDGLVQAGVLTDDNSEVIGSPAIWVVMDKDKAYSYEVTVEELSE